jgi:hypothetical protein
MRLNTKWDEGTLLITALVILAITAFLFLIVIQGYRDDASRRRLYEECLDKGRPVADCGIVVNGGGK